MFAVLLREGGVDKEEVDVEEPVRGIRAKYFNMARAILKYCRRLCGYLSEWHLV